MHAASTAGAFGAGEGVAVVRGFKNLYLWALVLGWMGCDDFAGSGAGAAAGASGIGAGMQSSSAAVSGGPDTPPMTAGNGSAGIGVPSVAPGGRTTMPAGAGVGGSDGTAGAPSGGTFATASGTGGGGASGTGGGGGAEEGSSASGGGGAPGTAGAGGATVETYPPLAAGAIGTPTQIASGFRLAESPLWDPCTDSLMFSDVQGAGGGGAIHSLSADGKVSIVAMNTGNTNGFAYDIDGSLILAQMTGHIARRDTSGAVKVLEPSGSGLHTPDDVVVRSDGTIYFSDGDFCPIGNLLGFDSVLPVYMLGPGSATLVQLGTAAGPNGIELSPDEKTLYVAGYGDGTISTFDVAADGTAKKAATSLASGLSNPDSLCLDAAGNLYVGVTAGVQVIAPDGKKVKLIPISAPAGSCSVSGVTNCTFGGDDGKTLYITAWTTLWRIDNMPIPGLDWIVGQKRARCQ